MTEARRAFERPIAIACFVDRAPCLPRRTCSTSSRTYSPACVVGARPARLAAVARLRVVFSGIADYLLIARSAAGCAVDRRSRVEDTLHDLFPFRDSWLSVK